MFNIIGDIVNTTVGAVSSVFVSTTDAALFAISFGQYGELNKNTLINLVGAGITLYEISEVTGIALSTLEAIYDE